MIGTLTPVAKSEPAQTGAKPASASPVGTAFAALFGAIGEGDGTVTATPAATAPVAVATAAPATPVVTDPTAIPVDPIAAAPVADPATPAVDPSTTADATLAGAAVAATVPAEVDVAADADACAPQMPVKPVTLKQPAAETDDEAVKLPTLPADFVAQKAPKPVQAAAQDDSEDTADSDTPDESAEQAPQPQVVMPLPVEAAPAPVQAAAVTAAAITTDAQASRRATVKAAATDKVEVATKADIADTTTVSDAPPSSDDRGSVATFANLVTSHASNGAHQQQAPVAAPVLAAAPQPQPAPADQQPVARIAQQHSVALDDLMVAGAGDSAWLDRVASDISTLAKGEARQAHMKLNPASLGEMSIKLDMDGAKTRVHFTVDTPQVQAMIADNAPRLTSLVQANGLKLDGATVDLSQQRSGGQSDRAPHQQQQGDNPSPFTRATRETARMIERTRIATRTERFA